MRFANIVAFCLVLIGALVWGLIGIFNFNLVAAIFGGSGALISRIIYSLVGIAAVWMFFYWIIYKPFKRAV
jgi:uncharacterized membrane protein YuzA (DUF378 family)